MLGLLVAVIMAAQPVQQVDTSEVFRRGDSVTIAGEGPRGPIEEALRQSLAPPADDSDMWYITVLKTPGCRYCDHLISDFQSAPELLAFVYAPEQRKAWAHFNVYNSADKTQEWRVGAYRVVGFPTLIIQPPRNGSWGNPKTVVWQHTGYDGNAKKLAYEISNAVKKYAAKMAEKGYPKRPVELSPKENETEAEATEPAEATAPTNSSASHFSDAYIGGHTQPWGPSPPKPDPFNPQYPTQVPTQPTWPPQDQQQPLQVPQVQLPNLSSLIGTLFGAGGMTNLLLLLMIGLKGFELIAARTPNKIDDQIAGVLSDILKTVQSKPKDQNQ